MYKYTNNGTSQSPYSSIPVYMGTGIGSPFQALSSIGLRKLQVDNFNNLWIVSYYDNKIFKIPLSTGILSTFAGKGSTGGFSGDGGPAILADFNMVEDVAVDTSGAAPFLPITFPLHFIFITSHLHSSFYADHHLLHHLRQRVHRRWGQPKGRAICINLNISLVRRSH